VNSAAPVLAAALLLLGCSAGDQPAPAPEASATPPQVADFAALASKDCSEVVQFYLEALGGREWARAALVWGDPAIGAARLEAVFAGYKEMQVEWTEPFVEGAAGSLYCTVAGKLSDARDPATPVREGTLLLRRVNDVPGATPEQLRWTLRSSTFVEPLAPPDRTEH
jgi:hypothetical protein